MATAKLNSTIPQPTIENLRSKVPNWLKSNVASKRDLLELTSGMPVILDSRSSVGSGVTVAPGADLLGSGVGVAAPASPKILIVVEGSSVSVLV